MNAGDTLAIRDSEHRCGDQCLFGDDDRRPATGTTITITYVGAGRPTSSTTGANGNIIGAYTYVSGSQTEQWDAPSRLFSGGTSPSQWQITLPFATLVGSGARPRSRHRNPETAMDLFSRSAGRRFRAQRISSGGIELDGYRQLARVTRSPVREASASKTIRIKCSIRARGPARVETYSGGTIHSTSMPGSSVSCTYTFSQDHSLYLGTRLMDAGTLISIVVDAGTPFSVNLNARWRRRSDPNSVGPTRFWNAYRDRNPRRRLWNLLLF